MTPEQYTAAAMRTAAGPEVFHIPHPVQDPKEAWVLDIQILADLCDYIRATNKLDRWKSRLFYNKDKPEANLEEMFKDLNEDWSIDHVPNPQLIHAILGIATEGAELVADLVNVVQLFSKNEVKEYPASKWLYSDRQKLADLAENMSREQGDIEWYQELLAVATSIPVELSREANIQRLKKRFPDKFSEADAVARADEQVDPLANSTVRTNIGPATVADLLLSNQKGVSAVRNGATADVYGKAYAKMSQLEDGQFIQVDGGFTCVTPYSFHQIRASIEDNRLFFLCDDNKTIHYLDGQLGTDGDTLVGVYVGPEAMSDGGILGSVG